MSIKWRVFLTGRIGVSAPPLIEHCHAEVSIHQLADSVLLMRAPSSSERHLMQGNPMLRI
jgi:hypothetical protein